MVFLTQLVEHQYGIELINKIYSSSSIWSFEYLKLCKNLRICLRCFVILDPGPLVNNLPLIFPSRMLTIPMRLTLMMRRRTMMKVLRMMMKLNKYQKDSRNKQFRHKFSEDLNPQKMKMMIKASGLEFTKLY